MLSIPSLGTVTVSPTYALLQIKPCRRDLDLAGVTGGTGPITAKCGGDVDVAPMVKRSTGDQRRNNVPQFPFGVPLVGIGASGTVIGTTFNAPAGRVVIVGGTYTGTTTFNVAQGARLDLTGGQTVTYSGTLTGSGAARFS